MPYKFESPRLTKEHKIVGIATLVLFISLFLPWFGWNYLGLAAVSLDGLWHGYMYITLLVCIAVLGLLALSAGMEELPFKLPIPLAQAVFIGTIISFVLTAISFLAKPGGTSWKFGSYLGLLAAIVAIAPRVIPALQARRAAGKTSTR